MRPTIIKSHYDRSTLLGEGVKSEFIYGRAIPRMSSEKATDHMVTTRRHLLERFQWKFLQSGCLLARDLKILCSCLIFYANHINLWSVFFFRFIDNKVSTFQRHVDAYRRTVRATP